MPDRRVYTRLAVTCVASAGGENQTGSQAPGALMGFELFTTRVSRSRGRQARQRRR